MQATETASDQAGELPVTLTNLIEAGVHFGHQTRRWNPKMAPFIYGSRGGIHIIDLDQTAALFERAYNFIVKAVARGGHVLFVGTKKQAADVIAEEAQRAGQYYATGRWLGGTLTNFRTVRNSIERLREVERMLEDGSLSGLSKKEVLGFQRERERLEKFLGGIKQMDSLPSVIFVVDPNHEHIAIREGRRLGIPIVGLVDTNCNPELIDFVIPGNDDAIRSIRLITSSVADACLAGLEKRKSQMSATGDKPAAASGAAANVPVEFARVRRSEAEASAEPVAGQSSSES